MEKIEEDAMWHEGIVFSDEAEFYQTRSVNRHKFHYYNTQNPHILHKEKLKTKGTTVCTAVIRDGVLSYDISHEIVTAGRYVSVLT